MGDPSIEGDLEPTLFMSHNSWKSSKPNLLKLAVRNDDDSVFDVSPIEGEVLIEAQRVVEVVKGRKELSTALRARFCLSVKLCGQSLRTHDDQYDLFMIDDKFDD